MLEPNANLIPLPMQEAVTIHFNLIVPESMANDGLFYLSGDIDELGNWKQPLQMQPMTGSKRRFVTVVEILPSKELDRRHGRSYKNVAHRKFEYKFLLIDSRGGWKWEEGKNRPCTSKEREYFDQWREQTVVTWGQNWWSKSQEDHAFVVVLREFMGELNSAVLDAQTWLYHYGNLEKGLGKKNLTSKAVNELVINRLVHNKASLNPKQVICLLAIIATAENLPRDIFSGWGTPTVIGGTTTWSTTGTSWGDGWTRLELEKVLVVVIDCLSKPELLDGELAKSLSASTITMILKGLKFLFKKAQWYDDYIWLRLVPFVQVLCANTGGARTISFVEPERNKYHLAEKNFVTSLEEFAKEKFIFIDPPTSLERYPVLQIMCSQSPNLSTLLAMSPMGNILVDQFNEETTKIFKEGLKRQIRTYPWPRWKPEAEIPYLIKLLQLCSSTDILELVDLTLQNDQFDEIDPQHVTPLLELCVVNVNTNTHLDEETLKKIQDNFAGVGRSVSHWLVRKFHSEIATQQNKSQPAPVVTTYYGTTYYTSSWSTTQTRKMSLSDVISRLNDLIKQNALDNFRIYFVDALQKLLAVPEDRDILIQELKFPKLDDWEPAVVEAFTKRAIRSVESLATTEKKQLKVFRILKNLTARNVRTMKFMLLDRLLSFSVGTGGNPSLENTITHSKLWVNFFELLDEISVNIEGKVDIELQHIASLCKQVKDMINKLAVDLLKGCIKLLHLQLFLSHKERIHELMISCKLEEPDKMLLQVQGVREEQLNVFEKKVTQLQCFINIFCSPVLVDTGTLPGDLIHIRKDWNDLVLIEVQNQFDHLSVMPHLDWLYELRGSELFLIQWKNLGHSELLKELLRFPVQILQKAVSVSYPKHQNSPENLFRIVLDLIPPPVIPIPPPLPGQPRDIPVPPPPPPPAVQAQPPVGPPALNLRTNLEDIPLTINTVVALLIPAAQVEWTKFFKEVDQGKISFPQLEKTFSNLKGKQVGREIEFLWKTGHGSSTEIFPLNLNWIQQIHDLITSYRLLDGHRRRMAGLLHLLSIFRDHFQTPLEEGDELYISLRETNDTISKAWTTQALVHVRQYSDPVRKIFEKFSKNHLLYLDELCKSDALIQWYISTSSTEEFSQLLSITKSNTDDAIVLRAIAALQSTRNRLSNILYRSTKFPSLAAFLNEFASIEIQDRDIVNQLLTANEKFEFLMKIFAEKTRSPGMQACYDLKDIMDFGTYVWSSAATSATSTGLSLIYDKSQRPPLTLDDLIDLRNRLMLTKIPDELDIADLPNLIQKFIEQLKVLFEISHSLSALQNAGHFKYLKREENFPSAIATQVLVEKAAVLKAELEEWNEMMMEMRKKYYFLNFFSITQIVQLLDYLEEGDQAIPALRDILKYICPTLEAKRISVTHLWTPSTDLPPRTRLESLGKYLGSIFNNLPPISRATKNIVTGGSTYLFDEGAQGIYVIATAADKVLDLTFTLYVQQGRVPEPDEVLFCNKNTKIDDISLLLYRWAYARKHNRKDRLFTLVNIEALWYTTQAKIVEIVQSFGTELDNCSFLAFITNQQEGQHILSAFQSRRVQVVPLEADILRALYDNLLTSGSTKHPRALVFSSPIPGAGKSHAIKAYVAESPHNRNYRHVPVIGPMTNSELITLLQRNPDTCLLSDEAKAYHVDIGPTHTSDLNDQLFQLLVTGMLQDESGRVYHRNEQDVFLLEIPNVFSKIQKKDQSKDSFLSLLPTRILEVTPDTLDLTTYELHSTDTMDHTWLAVRGYEIQFVCKYLQSFQNEKFLKFAATDEDFHPDMVPDLDPPTCFKLLSGYIRSDGPVSFILFSNFIKFAYQQFLNVTYYDLLTNMAVAGALDCPPFKNFIVDFLIKTAVDFSTRAVEADAPIRNELRLSGGGTLKLSSNEVFATRFDRMRHWEDSEHPFVVLNQADVQLSNILPGGIGIISLNPTLIDESMDKTMKNLLALNGFNFDVDYSKIIKEEAHALLRVILGVYHEDDPDTNYVLTFDNLMKMISIQLRVKCNIPVVIMGETGCGKTSLVRYLCDFIGVSLHKLDVHGGITDDYILEWMQKPISEAKANRSRDIYVFFDEINTCNSMSLFKNVLCDMFMNGLALPNNLKFIAACNPYRLLSEQDVERERIGLVFEHRHALDVIPDPLANLVYRVHPLPETLIEYVWDFGSLPGSIEQLYIHSILSQKYINDLDHPPKFVEQFLDFFSVVISDSHSWLRKRKYTCSLRDVSRCFRLLNWFKESLLKRVRMREASASKEQILKQACVLSLTHCYHSRLNELRAEYRTMMETKWNGRQFGSMYLSPGEFHRIAIEEQKYYAKQMISSGSGIALNEALCENIFMILVCILNMIPIFVVGKPGSSKSLSIELIGSHLNGKMSDVPFFQEYPAVEVFSYQCSPLSTSHGIEQTFHHAKRYQSNASNTIVVVLLDEVGLAEQSAHLPLKVLHKLLEYPEVAVVGISNWTLDRAKMNRAIHLTRPEPGIEDLKDTAMGIITNQHLSASLRSLAEAYYHVYHAQKYLDFYGLRDYYHLIKHLHRNLEDTMTSELLEAAVCRNFGGIPSELEKILNEFFSRVGLPRPKFLREKGSEKPQIIKLIESNIYDKHARHLMLLTHNDAALQLLFDQGLLVHEKTVVLFGSDFPADQSDLYICLNIQSIKSCMAKGQTVVLIHSENLYESLYDMLNQHYTEYQGQRYVRLAIGTTSKLCPIHNDFRVIVVVDINEAYTKLAPPLLNRFEKQIFLRQSLLQEDQQIVCSHLSKFIANFVYMVNKQLSTEEEKYVAEEVFVGYHSDTTSSLVLSLMHSTTKEGQTEVNTESVMNDAISRLLWLALPECVHLASKSSLQSHDWEKMYFYEQHHENLPHFLDFTFYQNLTENKWGDVLGIQTVVITFSPLSEYTNELFEHYPTRKELSDEDKFKQEQEELTSKIEELQRQLDRTRGEGKEDAEEQIIKQLSDTQKKLEECVKNQIQTQQKKAESLAASGEIKKEKLKIEGYKIPLCLKLHDFSSESELLHSVQNFFATDVDATLLIQCDPAAVSYQRIVHARYICEKERAEYKTANKGKRKHMVFLIHLSRVADSHYTFDFDTRWHYALVDDIKPAEISHIPPTIELLHGSELELLKSELTSTLMRTFRTCLARLIYPYERTSNDIQEQIEMMLELFDDEDFMSILKERMTLLMEVAVRNKSTSSSTSWQANVAANKHEIVTAGTFRAALFNTLSDTVTRIFMHILCYIDRNANLSLYFQNRNNRSLKELWLHIFQDPAIFSLSLVVAEDADHDYEPRYDVHSDGLKGPFRSCFPFSFVFCNSIEAMRDEAGKITANVDDGVGRLIHSTFGNFFETYVQPSQLEHYVRDYVHMCGHIANVPEEAQFKITRDVILKELSGILSVSKIHTNHWKNESRLQHVFRLLDIFGKMVPEVSEILKNLKHDKYTLEQFDLDISALVLSLLKPRVDEWATPALQREWVNKVEVTQPSLQTLLKGKSGEHWEKWEKLIFLRYFIRDVALPLGIPNAICLKFSQIITVGNFQQKATFDEMVDFLKTISQTDIQRAKRCSLMVELFVCEFCLAENTQVDPLLLKELLVDVLADLHPAFRKDTGLIASMPLKTFLFTFMLTTKNGNALKLIPVLEDRLKANLESPNNVLLVQCVEDLQAQRDFLLPLHQKQQLIISTIQQITTSRLFAPGTRLWEKFSDIGKLRYFLTQLAHDSLHHHIQRVPIQKELLDHANRLLTKRKDGKEELAVFSMRLFFLKQITRLKGSTLTQELLKNPNILKDMPWITEWCKHTRLQQFLRKKHLLQQDPFYLSEGYPGVRKLVQTFLDGNPKPLQETLASKQRHPNFKGLLLMAIFMEVSMTYTVEAGSRVSSVPLIQNFFSLLAGSGIYSPTEIKLVEYFVGNTFPTYPEIFLLTPKTKLSQVLLLSCIIHIAAVTFIGKHDFLGCLLLAPENLGKIFIPTMPNDERLALMQVMGGGWYECPKGHTYYVSECGRPTQEYVCPTCKTKIGGLEHVLDKSNKEASRSDQTLTGYLLTGADNYPDTFASERNLPPTAFRILRFFTHVLLSLSSKMSPDLEAQVKLLTGSQQEDVSQFVTTHFLNDWNILKKLVGRNEEEVAVFVHLVCSSLIKQTTGLLALCPTKESRVSVEESFHQAHLSSLLADIEGAIVSHYRNYEADDSLMAELRETNVISGSPEERKLTLFTLWRFRQPMTMAHLTMQFNLMASNKADFPILHMFLMDEEKVRALRHLYHAIEWQTLLAKKFDKRIDKKFAAQTTIGDVLKDLPVDEARRWESAYMGFREAWNSLWQHVDRYTCMEIPQDWKTIILDEKLPICFCLMDEKDEGICSLALLNYMVDKHNQFFEKLNVMKGAGSNHTLYKVSSRMIKPSHLINYKLETELLPFLQRQVEQLLDYGTGATVHYNFERIQQHIIDTILAGKPQIDLEVRRFTYTNETRVVGAISLVKDLVPQVVLTEDIKSKIKYELGNNLHQTNKVMRLLEICIGFLAATGGSHIHQIPGDQYLASYIKDTLLMKEDLGATIEKTIQLRHLVALWNLLEKLLNIDPLESVMPKYGVKLPANIQQMIKDVTVQLDLEVLLPIMKECLQHHLSEGNGHIGAEVPVWDLLDVCSVPGGATMGKLDWFKKHFPRTIECKYFLNMYKFLNGK